MAIAVLTYHSQPIEGNDYHDNDHIALAEDLSVAVAAGIRIMSASELAAALFTKAPLPQRAIVLTCDDGADLDFVDRDVPGWGEQRSFYGIVRDREPTLGSIIMTSFVIADPAARATLEHTCLGGAEWLGEAWWPVAVATGSWHLGVHCWDHHHPTLPRYRGAALAQREFRGVLDFDEADLQVRKAADYLRAHAPNPADCLFAYPYGNASRYLAEEYFPLEAHRHRMIAAFTTDPEFVHPGTGHWKIPRFVCRLHWRSQGEFRALLRQL
jgi:hypothetical protein